MTTESNRPPNEFLLNPFIFPAETRGRFILLVVAALALVWRVGNLFVTFIIGPPRMELIQQTRRLTLETLAGRASTDLTATELMSLHEQLMPLYQEILVTSWLKLVPPLLFMVIIVVGASLIYRNHPRRIQRRYRSAPQALTKAQAPNLMACIEEQVKRENLTWPLQVQFKSDGLLNGHAFGLRGQEILLLHGDPKFFEDSAFLEMYKAVALHELGHIANRDTQDRETTWAIWLILVILMLSLVALLLFFPFGLSFIPGLTLPDGFKPGSLAAIGAALWLSGQIIAMLAIVWTIRAGLIRIREFYADWRVVSWHLGEPLLRILKRRSGRSNWWEKTKGWKWLWQRWYEQPWWDPVWQSADWLWQKWAWFWQSHPSHFKRQQVLQNPLSLFKISADLPFLTGLLLAFLSVNVMFFILEDFPLLFLILEMIHAQLGKWLLVLPAPLDYGLVITSTITFGVIIPLLLLSGVLFIVMYLIVRTIGIQAQREALADLALNARSDWGYLRLLPSAVLLAVGLEVGFLVAPLNPLTPNSFVSFMMILVWLVGFSGLTWIWLVYLRASARLIMGAHAGTSSPKLVHRLITISSTILLTILYWPILFARITIHTGTLPTLTNLLTSFGIRNPADFFLYTFVITTVVLFILALIVYLFWAGLTLIGVTLWLLLHKTRCPACDEVSPYKLVVGRSCPCCYQTLAPWVYIQPQPASADSSGQEGLITA